MMSALVTLNPVCCSLTYLAVSLTRTPGGVDGPTSSVPAWGQYLMSLISPIALALAIDQVIFYYN